MFSLIERSGGQGATRTDLAAAIRPKPRADDLDAITTRLEGAGLIVSGCMRFQPTGRPGMRFFTAEVGMPFVGTDGVAVVRQEVSGD